LFLLAAKKKVVIVSFRQDTKILNADRTAGSAAVCKVRASIPDFALADRARTKIENGRHKTQNSRDKGGLIFYSYCKLM